jgi:hypothetical protein
MHDKLSLSNTVEQSPAFAGWLKDHLPWRQVANGGTIEDCWFALLRVPAMGNHAERIVLAAGRTPHN